jgi:hypothetical protein
MREVSPVIGVSVDDYLKQVPAQFRTIIEEIRRQKSAGQRQSPSARLIDRSDLMTKPARNKLLDAVAALVDENYAGRAEMCLQYAALLDRALLQLKFPSRPVVGTAVYFDARGEEIFRWRHAWVRVGDEVIDGNVDSLAENPLVPKTVSVVPYWGPITEMPSDRRLREDRNDALPSDVDVDNIWWPELQQWVSREML